MNKTQKWYCQCGVGNLSKVCVCGTTRSEGKVKRCKKWTCQCGSVNIIDFCMKLECRKSRLSGAVEKIKRNRRDFANSSSSTASQMTSPPISSEVPDAKESLDNSCEICFSNPKNRSFSPCGHPVCSDCVAKIKFASCPFCKGLIEKVIPRFD
jgi:hypothetical protein